MLLLFLVNGVYFILRGPFSMSVFVAYRKLIAANQKLNYF